MKADMYRMESPEMNPCIFGQQIFKNGAKETQMERVISPTNIGESTHLHAKEGNWILISDHPRKSNENLSKA